MGQVIIGFIVNRLKEPSSWASIAALLGFMGYNIEDELWQHIVTVGAGICGLVGFIARENAKPDLVKDEDFKPLPDVTKKSNLSKSTQAWKK